MTATSRAGPRPPGSARRLPHRSSRWRRTSSVAASGTLTCALPGLPVAQGDLVGLGDVVGLDGSQSLAQAFARLPQQLEGVGGGALRGGALRISPVFLDEMGLQGCGDFVGCLQRVVDGPVPCCVVNHVASIARQRASGGARTYRPGASCRYPARTIGGGGRADLDSKTSAAAGYVGPWPLSPWPWPSRPGRLTPPMPPAPAPSPAGPLPHRAGSGRPAATSSRPDLGAARPRTLAPWSR